MKSNDCKENTVARLRKTEYNGPVTKDPYERIYEMPFGNFTIERGDLIKVAGEYGTKFKFESITTNPKNGAVWVDCFEMWRGRTGAYRSFAIDRVKRIPKRRPRKAKPSVV
jgi:hypothetical protein